MDTSQINVSALNETNGILIGQDTAPLKIIEFVNLRCPFCRQWFDEKNELLNEYVDAGKLQRVIKLFDKTKPGLDKGNIMHQFVPKKDGAQALLALEKIYASLDVWGELTEFSAIAAFAETELHLTRDADETSSQGIVAEAEAAKIIFVPTMILKDEIFDQKISTEALTALLNA